MPFLLLIATLMSFAFTHSAFAVECVAKMPPQINVTPKTKNIKYDFTKTKSQLNSFDVDTISPYGPQHRTVVSGLMSGSIQTKSQVELLHETYKHLDRGCVYLKTANVTISIDPTIYIAREYRKGSCYHNAVLTHEMKHVREDQLIVNKYVGRIGRALKDMIDDRNSFGPYRLDQLEGVQQNIQNSINKAVQRFSDDMNKERRRRQQAIDNIEEYESIGARCPKERS